MGKMKSDSALNKAVENAVNDITKLEKKYKNKEVVYFATRRYNDRIYCNKKKAVKTAKPKAKKCPKKRK